MNHTSHRSCDCLRDLNHNKIESVRYKLSMIEKAYLNYCAMRFYNKYNTGFTKSEFRFQFFVKVLELFSQNMKKKSI